MLQLIQYKNIKMKGGILYKQTEILENYVNNFQETTVDRMKKE